MISITDMNQTVLPYQKRDMLLKACNRSEHLLLMGWYRAKKWRMNILTALTHNHRPDRRDYAALLRKL